jgi:DNA-binding response OmpR family regulator
MARLRALTRRRSQEVPPGIRLGDLHIDTRRRSVRRGGRAIDLTAREFDFLLCLARNAGRVVTRTELLSEVWDDPHHTHSNVIDVYASRLRRKIDEGEVVPMIATSRGVGYMIDLPPSAAPGGKGSSRSPGGG